MTELDYLYLQILHRPEDDTLRLVYADMYEEVHDTPTASRRAQFIRDQIASATITTALDGLSPDAHYVDDPYYAAIVDWLIGDGEALLAADPTLECLRAGRPTTLAWYVRGFVNTITIHRTAFLSDARTLFAAHPITEVRLHQARPARESAHRAAGPNEFVYQWAVEGPGTHVLPPSLFKFLPGVTPLDVVVTYPDLFAAQRALSAACVRFGRQYLPPLPDR